MAISSPSLSLLNDLCDKLGLSKNVQSIELTASCKQEAILKVEMVLTKVQTDTVVALITEHYRLEKIDNNKVGG